jgi:hypothetical protein
MAKQDSTPALKRFGTSDPDAIRRARKAQQKHERPQATTEGGLAAKHKMEIESARRRFVDQKAPTATPVPVRAAVVTKVASSSHLNPSKARYVADKSKAKVAPATQPKISRADAKAADWKRVDHDELTVLALAGPVSKMGGDMFKAAKLVIEHSANLPHVEPDSRWVDAVATQLPELKKFDSWRYGAECAQGALNRAFHELRGRLVLTLV